MISDIKYVAILFLTKTPLLLWLGLALVFSLIELCVDWKSGRSLGANRLSNLGCGLMLCITTFVSVPFFQMLFSLVAHRLGLGLIPVRSLFPHDPILSLICSVGIFMFVFDFFFYLWHRMEHKVRFMWDIHAVHHSERLLNSTSYLRQNWIDAFLQGIFVSLPTLLLLNVTLQAQYGAYFMIAIWNFWAHSSLRLKLGVFTPVLMGPQLHRLHHSVLKKHQNKNFAQFFPLWDILFRTYIPPDRNEFPPTGLASGEDIQSVRRMGSWPFQQWVRRLKA